MWQVPVLVSSSCCLYGSKGYIQGIEFKKHTCPYLDLVFGRVACHVYSDTHESISLTFKEDMEGWSGLLAL